MDQKQRRRTTVAVLIVAAVVIASTMIYVLVILNPGHDSALPNQTSANRNTTLRLVADGFTHPVRAVSPPDGSERLFVVDQIGKVWIVLPNGTTNDRPFIDISSKLVPLSASYDERGLLGLAFHPNYAINGKFYLWYSAPLDARAPSQWDHTNILSEFKTSADPNVADVSTERFILRSNHPSPNHNGGDINFGPDGFLYIPIGDGGGGNDVGIGHSVIGNGQDLSTVLGKILRIDIDRNISVSVADTIDSPNGGEAYGIPPDNPFVSSPGRAEIFAYGFRNPAFASFDPGGNHSYFVGNAGQELYEGVFLVEKGKNYGWPIKENGHCFDRSNSANQGVVCVRETGYFGEPLVDPIISLPHSSFASTGLSVVGGYVYRGSSMAGLQGGYTFGLWRANSVIWVTSPDSSNWSFSMIAYSSFEDKLGNQIPGAAVNSTVLPGFLLGFGLGADRELYALTTDSQGPSGSTGKVWKIMPG
ncbi:MAG TPA: PQQ-dependent sugar dehydrogenase [Methanomassiliicoccales archaeon]|jgi:glucose/arabinose dehydrogenase